MPHAVNRQAFATVTGPPLLRLYARLVALELFTKDRESPWPGGHDVCALLDNCTFLTQGRSPALLISVASLRTALQTLVCTGRDGQACQVQSKSYPGLRYLRHANDFPGGSTDADIQAALDVLDDLYRELANSGEQIC